MSQRSLTDIGILIMKIKLAVISGFYFLLGMGFMYALDHWLRH